MSAPPQTQLQPKRQVRSDDDEALERSWRAGSSQAFSTLFRRHYAGVVAYAQRFAPDRATAEDLSQQAFLNVLQRQRGRGSFKSLIYTVVRNLALNELRRRSRKYVAKGSLEQVEPPRTESQPLVAMIRDEEQLAFEQALARLPDEEREAFCLKESRGLTYAEVGQIMCLHPDAVRRRVAKAYTKIRDELNPGKVP